MLTRRGFLGTSLALGGGLLTRSSSGGGAVVGPPKRLIVVMCQGGWDTCYAVDPKAAPDVDVPAEGAVQRFGNLDVLCHDSRPSIAAFFAQHGDVTAIVRGIDTQSIIHGDCHRKILTGTRRETNPDMAAIVAHDCGNDLPLPYLILGTVAYTGPYAASAGRAGFQNQLGHLISDDSSSDMPYVDARGVHHLPIPTVPAARAPQLGDAEEEAIRRFHEASVERARAVRGAAGYNQARLADFLEGGTRGKRLKALRSHFGTPGVALGLETQVPLSVEAIAQDVSHTVMLNAGQAWDTHYVNSDQGPLHEMLFANLRVLVDELVARPGRAAGSRMIDDTVVAVVSEFSRTPKLSEMGKGHWPVAAALVIGGGVRGNLVVGGTTPTGDPQRIDLKTGSVAADGVGLTTGQFVGSVLDLCGVDQSSHLPAATPLEALRV